jgi:hypothetical protein
VERNVTGQQPRPTRRQLRAAQAEAVRRFGSDVEASVVPQGAGVGQHGEYVPAASMRQDHNGQRWYICGTCPTTKSNGRVWGARHPLKARRDAYVIDRPTGITRLGITRLELGSGFSFADALANATARAPSKPAPPVDVRLPAAPQAARRPVEPRTRRRSTSGIPPDRRVTGQRLRRCQDCGTAIPRRTRCNRCALRHWRATHPNAKRAQDQRYRATRPARVRALVRARVAQWRKRQQQKV